MIVCALPERELFCLARVVWRLDVMPISKNWPRSETRSRPRRQGLRRDVRMSPAQAGHRPFPIDALLLQADAVGVPVADEVCVQCRLGGIQGPQKR